MAKKGVVESYYSGVCHRNIICISAYLSADHLLFVIMNN